MKADEDRDYHLFCNFLQEACGIALGEGRQYLVFSRLKNLMLEQEIDNLAQLVQKMKQPSSYLLAERVVDAMTTNETLWFRDVHPFDIFKDKILPELQKKPLNTMRVWSAACSSGQEPYSLSMMVEEYRRANMGVLKRPVDIIATDLSASMLELCKNAEYDAFSLGRGMAFERLKLFFEPTETSPWRVKASIRQRVQFKKLNLQDDYRMLGKFDVVFCRNVLIYFSTELKRDVLRRIHSTLNPGGYLILGGSEGVSGLSDYYRMLQFDSHILYQAI